MGDLTVYGDPRTVLTMTQTSDQLHVQPMTGTVHQAADCSTGTARYGTVPSDLPAAEVDALVAAGRLKACRTCYVPPANR